MAIEVRRGVEIERITGQCQPGWADGLRWDVGEFLALIPYRQLRWIEFSGCLYVAKITIMVIN